MGEWLVNDVLSAVTGGTECAGRIFAAPAHVVYVANDGDGTLKIYDPATSAITASIAADSYAFEVQLNPAGTQAWVSDAGGSTVTIIDTVAHTVTGTITAGPGPAAVAFTPDGTPEPSNLPLSHQQPSAAQPRPEITRQPRHATGTATQQHQPDPPADRQTQM